MDLGRSPWNRRSVAAGAAAAIVLFALAAGGAPAAEPPPPKEKVTYLGVTTSPVDEVLAAQLALPKGVGLVVNYVDPASPAAKAGLQRHDVLHKLADQLLINAPQLAVLVRMRKPADTVTLSLFRGGQAQTLEAALGEREAPPGAADLGSAIFSAGPFGAAVRQLRFGPIGAAASMAMADGEHQLTIETGQGGFRTLTATDQKTGAVLFKGPINTDDERAAVPEPIRAKLERLEQQSRIIIRAGVHPGSEAAP